MSSLWLEFLLQHRSSALPGDAGGYPFQDLVGTTFLQSEVSASIPNADNQMPLRAALIS
jgi:hypothetical protein